MKWIDKRMNNLVESRYLNQGEWYDVNITIWSVMWKKELKERKIRWKY